MKRLICVVLLVCLLSGCSTEYPWEKADSWYCAELDLTVTFNKQETGIILTETSPLIWNGNTYHVQIGFTNIYFAISHDPDGEGVQERIVQGRWHYEKGNIVFTDFDNPEFLEPYTELVFVPQD